MTAAERQAYKMVRETCPDLDRVMDDLLLDVLDQVAGRASEDVRMLFATAGELIKKTCTIPLRDALIEVIGEKHELEESVEGLMERLNVTELELQLAESNQCDCGV